LHFSWGAKASTAEGRKSFTPDDLLQYVMQGFLWPSAWPGLASLFGIQAIQPPHAEPFPKDFGWLNNMVNIF
jgi:hypothetical protein